jgi:hypothetical protein
MRSTLVERASRNLFVAVVVLAACAWARPAVALDDIIFGGDFLSGSRLQWVRRHGRAGGSTITIEPTLVTAVRPSGANMSLDLQLPPDLNTEVDYPYFSAMKVFGPSGGTPPAVGDCVIASGLIANFRGATELSPATVTTVAGTQCGATPVTPYVTTVTLIATDTDTVTTDNQPGALAEALESVLVRVSATAQTANGGAGAFVVGESSSGPPVLSVGNFFYQYSSTAGSILQITGVVDEFDPMPAPPSNFYQLLPRGAADIVPQ